MSLIPCQHANFCEQCSKNRGSTTADIERISLKYAAQSSAKRNKELEARVSTLETAIIEANEIIRDTALEASAVLPLMQAPSFASKIQEPMIVLNNALQDISPVEPDQDDLREKLKTAVAALEAVEKRSYGSLENILSDIPSITRNALAEIGEIK